MATIFIGVAWPYANGPFHFGHFAGAYLPPDIFARYHRMKGNRVLMVSGSDMHGTPVTVQAEKEGLPPDVVAEKYHKLNSDCLSKLGISYDLFTSTSTRNHEEVVQDIFLRLHEKGCIYKAKMNSPYCEKCRRFLPDRYVEGTCPHCGSEGARGDQCDACGKMLDGVDLVEPRCKICLSTPMIKETEHFFLKLTAFEQPLKDFIKDKGHWRQGVLNFTKNWLDAGLKDRPLTRDLEYGIRIPLEGYESKRIYVWFEAVIGYLSASKEWARRQGKEDAWKEFWTDKDAKCYYFLGKDNIVFHTIIWPSMLMGYGGLNLPYDVPANEFLTLEGAKISKSKTVGGSIWLPDYLEKFEPDPLRYYLIIQMPETHDANFSWDDFARRNDDELLAVFGNFVHRVMTFASRHFGKVPEADVLAQDDEEIVRRCREISEEVGENLVHCRFRDALRKGMELARAGNQYFDRKAPWDQVKHDKRACATTIHVSIRVARTLAVIWTPFLPFSAQRLWTMLGYEGNVKDVPWDDASEDIPGGQEFGEIVPLFRKLEEDKYDARGTKAAEEERSAGMKTPPQVQVLNKLDIRAAKVLGVRDHPKADSLILIDVSLGDEERILVAGLKKHYQPHELKGKTITVLCNLKPAKLRGVESKGMLLAASDEKVVSVLVSSAEPGTQVCGTKGAPEITIDDFKSYRIEVLEHGGEKVVSCVLEHGESVELPVTLDRDVAKGSKVR